MALVSESKHLATLYLDACCLNRPFDDQTQVRIRLEAEAILLILFQIYSYGWEWIGSEVLSYEIDQTPDQNRRLRVKSLMTNITRRVPLEPTTVTRAEEVQQLGFRTYDALHVASAERGGADVLMTTDDRFVRSASRNAGRLDVRVSNPLTWIAETFR